MYTPLPLNRIISHDISDVIPPFWDIFRGGVEGLLGTPILTAFFIVGTPLASLMLAEIQATCLCLLVMTHAYLLKKCQGWQDERHDFTAWIRDSATKFDEDFTEIGALLDDIAEGLGGQAPDPEILGSTHPSNDVKSILTDLFINKMIMPKVHGAQTSKVGKVHQEELISPSEQIQESSEREERSDIVGDSGRIDANHV